MPSPVRPAVRPLTSISRDAISL